MNTKVVPNPEQKGWEADGTTPNGTPIYKWESGGSSGGSAESAVLQDREEDQQVVSKFTVTANPTQDGMGLTNIPNKLVVDVDEKRASFIAGSPNSLISDSYEPWDVDLQGSLNMKSLGFPYSDIQYTAYGLSNSAGSIRLDSAGFSIFSGTINAPDATFSGTVTAGETNTATTTGGVRIGSSNTGAAVIYTPAGSTHQAFQIFRGVNNRASITAEGAATFYKSASVGANKIDHQELIGSYQVMYPGVSGGGSWYWTGNQEGKYYIKSGGSWDGGTTLMRMASNGEANFAGNVTSGQVTLTTQGIYRTGKSGLWFSPDAFTPMNGNGGATTRITDLGGTANTFKDGYFSGTVNFGQKIIASIGGGLSVGQDGENIVPCDASGSTTAHSGKMDLGADTAKFADAYLSGSVKALRVIQDGAPVIDAKGLINTLSTLRNATKDETTLEGLRDSIGNAIGGLIEEFEAEIAAMPAPETGTMETLQ